MLDGRDKDFSRLVETVAGVQQGIDTHLVPAPGTNKNLDLMLSLFADDATLTSGGKTYKGKDEIRSYWQAAGPFQPQNQWVAYTPAFRIKYAVEGDRAQLYFECLYVDKAKNNIAAHTNSDDTLVRVNGKWLIKDMKASSVPEL